MVRGIMMFSCFCKSLTLEFTFYLGNWIYKHHPLRKWIFLSLFLPFINSILSLNFGWAQSTGLIGIVLELVVLSTFCDVGSRSRHSNPFSFLAKFSQSSNSRVGQLGRHQQQKHFSCYPIHTSFIVFSVLWH